MGALKSSDVENKMQRLKAALMMVMADLIIAGFNVSYKVASHDGMNMSVLITYRYLFALICMSPFALFTMKRSERSPKLTWAILFQAFVCGIFGGPMSQNLYAKSLVLTSATFAAAFSNLIPPFTFVIAVLLRLEKVEIGKILGKAKVIGTLVAVGGAMLLTFYKGQQLNIRSTHFSLLHDGQRMNGHMAATRMTSTHQIMGSILAMGSSLSYGLYLNLQSKMSVDYPCHYSGTFLFCSCAFIQSFAYAVCTERSWSQWKLGWNVRLFCSVFQGVTTMGYIFMVMTAVHLQGPLFVSIFNPLVLVFVAISGFLVLDEKLYVGTLLGSIIVIIGLYLVLWGKSKEIKRPSSKLKSSGSSKDVNDASNTATMTTTLQDLCMAHTTTLTVNEESELVEKSPTETHKEQVTIEEV